MRGTYHQRLYHHQRKRCPRHSPLYRPPTSNTRKGALKQDSRASLQSTHHRRNSKGQQPMSNNRQRPYRKHMQDANPTTKSKRRRHYHTKDRTKPQRPRRHRRIHHIHALYMRSNHDQSNTEHASRRCPLLPHFYNRQCMFHTRLRRLSTLRLPTNRSHHRYFRTLRIWRLRYRIILRNTNRPKLNFRHYPRHEQ